MKRVLMLSGYEGWNEDIEGTLDNIIFGLRFYSGNTGLI